ncbi:MULTISPECIES: ABC transporter substrate-binding protein [unclassified Enterobacter]|uniref:ABC transporter substrate-binding protein n=1 Tax=unclassified Enterobacter TaxID=2608935 RepID=UPI0008EE6AC9|nr:MULTISPECIES: ABC transporter substrate-binding protein [unclassified Enterobacter]SFQ96245.1 oligogalacturonide transport system substrate-binding protein [Enterobacter sp. kpr-6]
MKKLLPLLIACCCVSAVAPAFSADQVTLRFSWWGGKARHQATLEALKAFEARYPDIKVKAEYTGWDGYFSRLTTQVNSGTEADLIQTNWNWLTLMSKKGDGFYDLNTLKETLDLTQYTPASLATTTVNGKLNALPLSTNVMAFYYNQTTWQKAGLELPKNWDELIKAGNVFKEKLGESYYPVFAGEQDSMLMIFSWMYQQNQKPMIDIEKKRLAWDHADIVKALGFYKTLIDNHVLPSTKVVASYGAKITPHYELKPWMNGEWAGSYNWNVLYPSQSITLKNPSDLVLGPYPMFPDARDAGQFQKTALMYSIGRNTRHPKEAALLMNFLVNDPAGILPGGLERGAPLSKIADATLREKGILKDSDPVIAGLLQSFAVPNAFAATPFMEDMQINALFTAARENIDYGKMSVEEAASDLEQKANRILRRIMR